MIFHGSALRKAARLQGFEVGRARDNRIQWLHSGSTVEIHGNPWIFEYFSKFLGYFLDFWSNMRVFGENKVGIV